MKSLEERQADRLQRRANNAAESTQDKIGASVAHAESLVRQAREAIAALPPEGRERLEEALRDGAEDSMASEAEPDGLSLAGVGIVNPKTVPGEGQETKNPDPDFDPAKGNQNGQAVEGQTGEVTGNGWGGSGDNSGKPELKTSMTVAEIEKIAEEEGVDISEASNNESRIALIEQARKDAEAK